MIQEFNKDCKELRVNIVQFLKRDFYMRVKEKAMRMDGYYAMGYAMGILALEEDYILEVEDYILLEGV